MGAEVGRCKMTLNSQHILDSSTRPASASFPPTLTPYNYCERKRKEKNIIHCGAVEDDPAKQQANK